MGCPPSKPFKFDGWTVGIFAIIDFRINRFNSKIIVIYIKLNVKK